MSLYGTTYFKGDYAEYTGNMERLHGGVFYQIRLLEGHLKGQTKLVKQTAEQKADAAARDAEWPDPLKEGKMRASHSGIGDTE